MADQLLWRIAIAYRLYDLSAFSNGHALLRKHCVAAKTEFWSSCKYQFNVKIWKLWKTWKYKNFTIKNSKSRNYTYSHKICGKELHHFTASSTTPVIPNFAHSAARCCIPKACRKHLILSFYQRKKKYSIRRQWLPAKDLPQL